MLIRLCCLVSMIPLFLIAGCAGQTAQPFKRSDVWSAQNGIFYFYREHSELPTGDAPWKVSVDGQVLGQVRPGEFIVSQWKSGKYVVLTQYGETLLESEAVLEPRGEIFVTLAIDSGLPRMVYSSSSEALPILEGLSRAKFERGIQATKLEKRESGVVVIENPAVARTVFVYPATQARLRGEGNCHAAYGMQFRIDRKGFPQDIKVRNQHQFTPEQTELMVKHFEDYRFHTYRENGKPVEREATRIMLFHGPREECPILPRDRAAAGGLVKPDARGLACPDLATLDHSWAAHELWSATRECMDAGRLEDAFRLFVLARATTGFDMRRVEDKSAHFLGQRMLNDAAWNLDPRILRRFNAIADEGLKPATELHAQTCQLLERVGHPAYHPEYMIRTGADRFFGVQTDGLVDDFDPEATWADIVDHGEKCEALRKP